MISTDNLMRILQMLIGFLIGFALGKLLLG